MEDLFIKLLNMSITASWLILAIILVRLIFKRAPKFIRCILWALVGIRLIVPFSFDSFLSLVPSSEPIPQDIIYSETPVLNTGIPPVDNIVNPVLDNTVTSDPFTDTNTLQTITYVASVIWIIGVAVLIIYSIVSYIRIVRRVKPSINLDENIYINDDINSPFILGIIRPRIYLPSDLSEQERACVVPHEKAHLKRGDHLWKPLSFAILTVYWFNPLIWVAYILLCRDIELACDERVIKKMESDNKLTYSEVLLSCSVPRHMIIACPLAFGEVGVKSRIKSVLNYKKPGFWIILAAILVCIAITVGFMTNPISSKVKVDDDMLSAIEGEVNSLNRSGTIDFDYACSDVKVLFAEAEEKDDGYESITTVYAWVLYQEYKLTTDGIIQTSGSHIPMKFTLTTSEYEHGYYYVDSWMPRDGAYYSKDMKNNFPWFVRLMASNSEFFIDEQQKNCYSEAEAYFYGYSAENNSLNVYLDAKIIEVYDKQILVAPLYDTADFSVSDEICVSTAITSSVPLPTLKEGTDIRIMYDGLVAETYPLQISNVFSIYSLTYLNNSTSTDKIILNSLLEEDATYYIRDEQINPDGYPTLILSNESDRFVLTYGVSNNIVYGTYELQGDTLTLYSNLDFGHISSSDRIVFIKSKNSYVYDKESSYYANNFMIGIQTSSHTFRSAFKDGDIFNLAVSSGDSDSPVPDDSDDFTDQFVTGSSTYDFRDTANEISPTVYLDHRNKTFDFMYTFNSDYDKSGTYELSGDTLKLIADDEEGSIYIFKVTKNSLIFDKANSAPIPESFYGIETSNQTLYIPDGAIFEKY
ncbi:MAG: hypothetical protein E7266_00645 [Lachnospiraceae bacterium]|nr:hypothetical protein [Lachnospiraceae bacterium]